MKMHLKMIPILFFVLCAFFIRAQETTRLARPPFTRGVNLTVWFEAPSPGQIQFARFTKKDFENIKSLGCDVIRLPINLHFMTGGAPEYNLNPLFLEFLDQAVTWAEELDLYIILDNHTFDPIAPTDPKIEKTLLKVWPQMAEHFKDRSTYVLYEVLNEPHGIDSAKWAKVQGKVIEAIRAVDSIHTIVVGAANYNNYRDMTTLPVYKDTNLIYTFHFYDPFLFTHQGAAWTGPSLSSLGGMPFPGDAGPLPAVPADLKGTWVENDIKNYKRDASPETVKKLLDIAVNFAEKRKAAVFCGEFGVYIPNSKNEDRVRWYALVREYLEEKNMAWTSWDYVGGFGIFESPRGGSFESDLNVPLVEAMGLTAPSQIDTVLATEKTGFDIFADFPGAGFLTGWYQNTGTVDFYSTDAPASGKYAIRWGNGPRYDSFAFDTMKEKDLSLLETEGYTLELMVRTKSAKARFDVRFVNPSLLQGELPWRASYTVEGTAVPPDGMWHKVRIPLSDMKDSGAWKEAWFPPEGKFSWKRITRFEVVAEHHALADMEFFIDDIRVTR